MDVLNLLVTVDADCCSRRVRHFIVLQSDEFHTVVFVEMVRDITKTVAQTAETKRRGANAYSNYSPAHQSGAQLKWLSRRHGVTVHNPLRLHGRVYFCDTEQKWRCLNACELNQVWTALIYSNLS